MIPAAIAPNRFCKGACDFDFISPSAELRLILAPELRVLCSDLMRTDVGSAVCILGLLGRVISFVASLPSDLLGISSGDEDLAFRLRCGDGDEPELREDSEVLLLAPFPL